MLGGVDGILEFLMLKCPDIWLVMKLFKPDIHVNIRGIQTIINS